MEWTRDHVISLINQVHGRPLLWNSKLSDYRNKLLKQDAIEEIALSMNVPSYEITKKLHNLKVQFSREHCKVLRSKQSSNGGDDVYVPKWFAYKPLLFLRDTSTPYVRTSLYEYSPNEYLDIVPKRETDEEDHSEHEAHIRQMLSIVPKAEYDDDGERSPANEDTEPRPPPAKKRRSSDARPDEAQRRGESPSDELNIFGQYVGEKLRNLDEYLQCWVKREINEIIFKAEMKHLQSRSAPQTPL